MADIWKGAKHELAQFFQDPSLETFRDLLRQHWGETNNLDFKWKWEEVPKLARHLLALANSGGGVVVLGVKEEDDGSFTSTGLDNLVDEANLRPQLSKFLPPRLEWRLFDFGYSASEYSELSGKKFQVLVVEDSPRYIPFVSLAESEGMIRKNAIYVRAGKRSVEPDYEALQEMLNRRIETGYSSAEEFSLQDHLAQLKVLYDQIPPSVLDLVIGGGYGDTFLRRSNPDYPEEGFYEFVRRMIEEKKRLIEQLVTTAL